jgi:hypothetical protein
LLSPVNTYEQRVAGRLLDFFSSRVLWNRCLWSAGTVLALHEVLEASVGQRDGHLSPETMQEVMGTAARLAENDPGVGNKQLGNTLRGLLFSSGLPRKELRHRGLDYSALRQVAKDIETDYLERWAIALASPNRPEPERTARMIAAHMLDCGFFPDFLHRWWTLKLRYENETEKSLADVVREAAALTAAPVKQFKVLVTFQSAMLPSAKGLRPPNNWLTGAAVSEWLKGRQFDSQGLKQQGGLLLEVSGRDPESAVEEALEKIELFSARILVTLRKEIRYLPYAWVDGAGRYSLERRVRGLKIGAIQRENRVWLESEPDGVIDPAVELLTPLQLGSSSAAIAGGWAAIEALLSEPSNRGGVAERLAAIVACAFPRAELTQLSYSIEKLDGAVAEKLRDTRVNRDRSATVAQAILDDAVPAVPDPSDKAAIERMRHLFKDPNATLNDICAHIKDAFARLYRIRNLVLHGGLTNAVGLRMALRTATPLVGAGVDRIVHFRYIGGVHPIELAARAHISLKTIHSSRPMACVDLLGA